MTAKINRPSKKSGPQPLPVTPRMVARSEYAGECLVWTGPVDKDGYGKITVRNRSVRVHRAAYAERHGLIGSGMFVLHRCDNPPCFLDAHLYLGTQQQNMNDRSERGRWVGGRPRSNQCRNGHQYTLENTGTSSRGHQLCIQCQNNRKAKNV